MDIALNGDCQIRTIQRKTALNFIINLEIQVKNGIKVSTSKHWFTSENKKKIMFGIHFPKF